MASNKDDELACVKWYEVDGAEFQQAGDTTLETDSRHNADKSMQMDL